MTPEEDRLEVNRKQRLYRQTRQLSVRRLPKARGVPPPSHQTRVYGGEPPGVLALRLFYGAAPPAREYASSASEP